MSKTQITLSFDTPALALAFLAAYTGAASAAPVVVGNVSAAPAAPTADSARTAEVAQPQVAAPAPTPSPSAATAPTLDFDRDVVPAMQRLFGANKAKFQALMTHYGFANSDAVKAAPAKWAEVVHHCSTDN